MSPLHVKPTVPAMTPERREEIREQSLEPLDGSSNFLMRADAARRELLDEVDRLTAVLDFERSSALRVRAEVERVLDAALGTREEDGAGQGLAGDVALLAERLARATAEVDRLTAGREVAGTNPHDHHRDSPCDCSDRAEHELCTCNYGRTFGPAGDPPTTDPNCPIHGEPEPPSTPPNEEAER